MKILINDFEHTQKEYIQLFKSLGYEKNELIFFTSYERTKEFIKTHLEKNKLHIDLIITNESKDSGNDILKANELLFYKNNLNCSFSKSNFRISSIPIILYSKKDTKSLRFINGFNSIIKKNENGNHDFFLRECERTIKEWRKMLFTDLDNLGIGLKNLHNFCSSRYYKNYYQQNIQRNAEAHFINRTKILSVEFIKAPISLNYDWIRLKNREIEEAILRFIDTYKYHIKYDRNNNERTILHNFFNHYKCILLRDAYSDLEHELKLRELNIKQSQICDYILKTEFPDFLSTTFFEVKKEDVKFYINKHKKRPIPSGPFRSHLYQVEGYKEYAENPVHHKELTSKLKYNTNKFNFILLAGRYEEKEEMSYYFEKDLKKFEGVDVLTYEELELININYLNKYNRLDVA